MKILLLGGIGEAKNLAINLHQTGHQVIYSLAGLVRQPDLPCPVISGGFSQFQKQLPENQRNVSLPMATENNEPLPAGTVGLIEFLLGENIQLVIDTTHPYASQMSRHAVAACRNASLPCWQYIRPAWHSTRQVPFEEARDWDHLKSLLPSYQRPFFTIGQQPLLDPNPTENQHWLIRTAIGKDPCHPQLTLITEIGPFSMSREEQLFNRYQPDLLVSKNSGGDSLYNKLIIATKLDVPIVILSRPVKPSGDKIFHDPGHLLSKLQIAAGL